MTEKVYGSYAFTADVVANLPATPSTAAGNLDAYFATDTYALFLGVAGVWSAAVLPSSYAITAANFTLGVTGGGQGTLNLVSDGGALLTVTRYSNDTIQPSFIAYKGRGTAAAPLAIATNDFIAGYNGAAWDGTAFRSIGLYRFKYIGAAIATDWGAQWVLSVGQPGTTTNGAIITADFTNGIQLGTALGFNKQRVTTFTTGQSKTITKGSDWLAIIVSAATIATGTIVMPAAPVEGQQVAISFGNLTITALTISPNTGQTILGAPTTAAANSFLRFGYDATAAQWYLLDSDAVIPKSYSTAALPAATTAGKIAYDTTRSALTVANGSAWTPLGFYRLAYADGSVPAGNTIANTAAQTAFASSYTLPANSLSVGSTIKLKLYGVYSTALAAPTITVVLKIGTVTVLTTGVISALVPATSSLGWLAEATLIVTAIGASGTIECQGFGEFDTSVTAGLMINLTNTAAQAIDTTAGKAITVAVTWGTASASNSITLRVMTVEIGNPVA